MEGRLVKWDADKLAGADPQKIVDPTQHPACIEVMDLVEGKTPKVIYTRRDDHAIDHERRPVSGESGDGAG